MQSEFYKKASRIIKPQYIQMMKYYIDINLYRMQENAQDKEKTKQNKRPTWKKIRKIGLSFYASLQMCTYTHTHSDRVIFLSFPLQFRLFVFLVFPEVLFKNSS